MPDVQGEILFVLEILPATLHEFAQVDADEDADMLAAFAGLLFGGRRSEVEALLAGPVGRPSIPVGGRGVPALLDCWARVLAAVEDYNALDTGLELVPESQSATVAPAPHCVKYVVVDGQVLIVVNYGLNLSFAGSSAPVYPLSLEAGVQRQVLAMAHAAIQIPIAAAP